MRWRSGVEQPGIQVEINNQNVVRSTPRVPVAVALVAQSDAALYLRPLRPAHWTVDDCQSRCYS